MEDLASGAGTGEVKQLIGFRVGKEEYGLELLRVKEVVRTREITWLPKAPSCVKGIINLRGDVIPIVDLRERFGLQSCEYTAMTRVVVAEVDGRPVGMVVDSASQVIRVPADQIDTPPMIMGEASLDIITGVGKIEGKLVAMIDVDRILSVDEMNEVAESVEAAKDETAFSRTRIHTKGRRR